MTDTTSSASSTKKTTVKKTPEESKNNNIAVLETSNEVSKTAESIDFKKNVIVLYKTADAEEMCDNFFMLPSPTSNPTKPDFVLLKLRPGINIVSKYYIEQFLKTELGQHLMYTGELKQYGEYTQTNVVNLSERDKITIIKNCYLTDMLSVWATIDPSFASSINTRIKELQDKKNTTRRVFARDMTDV